MATMIRKLTSRTACSLSKDEVATVGREKRTALYSMIGKVTRAIPGNSDYGPYLRLRGMFEATDLKTGEIKQSAVAIVPGILEELIDGAMAGGAEVSFAVVMGVEPDPGAGVGYRWYLETIRTPEQVDLLSDLRDAIVDALPSPSKKAS